MDFDLNTYKNELEKEDLSVRVVAMPSWELFDQQLDEYKESVLPSHVLNRVSIEMGISLGWERYVGFKGKKISIETFGASGTGNEVMELFGFSTKNVVNVSKTLLNS